MHAAKVPSMIQTGDVAVYIVCTLDQQHFHVNTRCNQSAWEAATAFFFFHSTIDTWAQGEVWALVYIKVNERIGFTQTESNTLVFITCHHATACLNLLCSAACIFSVSWLAVIFHFLFPLLAAIVFKYSGNEFFSALLSLARLEWITIIIIMVYINKEPLELLIVVLAYFPSPMWNAE